MHCPFCQHTDTRVIDSRVSEDGATIRRRRECEACGERFSTLETIELKLPVIIKSDGRRETFDARKLRLGLRPRVAQAAGVGGTDRSLRARRGPPAAHDRRARNRLRASVGEFVMAELRKLDHVGYVRFASVYRAFEDVADFREELDASNATCPREGQLPLLGAEVVPIDKNKKR